MPPPSLLEVMHRRSIDSLDPLSASVPAAMADIWSVLALCAVFPPPPSVFFLFFLSSFSFFFSFLFPYFFWLWRSKHLRLSHPVLNAGGVIKWMNKPAASFQTLTKYRTVSSAETHPDICLSPQPPPFLLVLGWLVGFEAEKASHFSADRLISPDGPRLCLTRLSDARWFYISMPCA